MSIETDFSNGIGALFSFHLFTGHQNWVEEQEEGGRVWGSFSDFSHLLQKSFGRLWGVQSLHGLHVLFAVEKYVLLGGELL